MEKQEPKYGLRTRKSEFKGKYREMLGANSTPVLANADRKVQVKEEDSQTLQDSEKERKILVVPIVVSDGGDILTENAIEIEISEDGTISTLCEDGDKPARIPDSAKKVGDPLDHIEEILKQNNQLIQSIPEAPSFKKRKLTDKIESQLSVLNGKILARNFHFVILYN